MDRAEAREWIIGARRFIAHGKKPTRRAAMVDKARYVRDTSL